MAEQPIKSSDIIDPSFLDVAIQKAKEFLLLEKELEEQSKANLRVQRERLSAYKGGGGSNGLGQQADASAQVAKELKNLEQLKKAAAQTEQALLKVEQERIKVKRELSKSEEEYNKQINKVIASSNNIESIYSRINTKLSQTRKEYRDLAIQKELNQKLSEKEEIRLTTLEKRIGTYNNALVKVDERMGQHTRKVGNYASAFDGLGNSVNQLTRELPAFTVSAQTGFLAISNNLPIFFDQLQKINAENAKLATEGKKGESVLKQLGGAVFSLGTLLSVGVTLLTLYGKELVTWIATLFEGEKALESVTKANESYRNSLNQTREDIGNLTIDLRVQLGLISKVDAGLIKNENERNKELKKQQTLKVESLKTLKEELGVTDLMIKNYGKTIEYYSRAEQGLVKKNILSANETKNVTRFLEETKKRNYADRINIDAINEEYNIRGKLVKLEDKGSEANKARQRDLLESLIKQRTAYIEIRQLQIDNLDTSRFKEEEQIRFNNEKAVSEIDLANKLEIEKTKIENDNYEVRKYNLKVNAKKTIEGQKQLNFDLEKLESTHQNELKKIAAENISEDEQLQLRYELEVKVRKDLLDLENKYQKELFDKVKADVSKTNNARIKQSNDLEQEEIKINEDAYLKKKAKRDFFDAEELNDINKANNEKKKLLIQEQADQKIILTDNYAEKQQIQEEANIKKRELDKKASDEERANQQDDLKQAAEFSSKVLDIIAKEQAEKSRLRQDSFDKDIANTQKNIDTQKNLAERGLKNTLAEEEARKLQLDKQKEDEKKQEIKRQKVLAFFKLFASYAEKDPNNALQMALRDTILAEAVSAAFIDGTENVGKDKQFTGNKFSNKQDGYLARFDGDERILNPDQNKKIGNLSNDALADLAYRSQNGLLDTVKYAVMPNTDFATNVKESALLMQTIELNKRIESLEKAVKDKPITNFKLDGYGNFISETIQNGFTEIRTHKLKKPRI